MPSNTVQYNAIREAKDSIESSAGQIRNVVATMNEEIAQAMGAGGAKALSGAAGEALQKAWNDFSNQSFPDIEQKLADIFDRQLPEWYNSFQNAEAEIESTANEFKPQ